MSNLVFAAKPKPACSFLRFAVIECLERIQGPASLAPKGCFLAAETSEPNKRCGVIHRRGHEH
jgi:hypothetical protein